MRRNHTLLLRRIRDDRLGGIAPIVALSLTAIAGIGGLVTQEAILYRAERALQASANLAALAGAPDINCCQTGGKAITTANSYAVNAISGQTVTMASGYPKLKCLTFLKNQGISCSGADNANAIQVKQQVTVPLVFGSLFGMTSKTLTATATAGGGGSGGGSGSGTQLDVMLIMDTTASMNNSDSSCSISGATRLDCAKAGARTLLQQFKPSLVNVGLMVFPGVKSSTASKDYDCSSSTQPTIVAYNASPQPQYQILAFSNDYKTSDTAASLNTSSNLVKAVGGGGSGCSAGMSAVGGVGTYYADVITKAQTALTSNGRSGAQKIIIFLSDGDAGASSSNVGSAKYANQCHQRITAAQAATSATPSTKVYAVAYGAPTSATPSSCSTDSPAISACSAMQQVASSASTFYSDKQNGSSSCNSSANSVSELVQIYNQIVKSLPPSSTTGAAVPRLVPNNVS